MKTFRIFGAGEWGLAVANHLSCLGHNVEIFLRNDNKISEFNKLRAYKDLGLSFSQNVIFNNLSDLNTLSSNKDIFNIIASSSSGFADIINSYRVYFKSCKSVVWLTKGLDHDSGLLFHEIIDQELSPSINKCIISGPSFAKDLVSAKPLKVSIASSCDLLANVIIETMETEYFMFERTTDIIGVEVSGVMKNISAILAGALTVNSYPNEYIEELIVLSQRDIKSIVRKITRQQKSYIVSEEDLDKTVLSPACYGDMCLTCYFNTSRNRKLGLKITGKYNLKKIINKIGTVEGYLSTLTLNNHKKVFGESKVVEAAYKILYLDAEPKKVLNELFN